MRMLVKLWHWIVGEPHPDKAVKGVNAAMLKLERAAAFQKAKAESLEAAAALAAAAAAAANEFGAKAGRIRTRLGEIFEA